MITNDMAFASYLLLKGYSVKAVHRKGRRVSWEFIIPEEDIPKLEAEWPSSESSKFFNFYQVLKAQLKPS